LFPLEIKIQKVFDNEIVEIIIIMASSLENQLLNNNVILYEYSNTGKATYDQFREESNWWDTPHLIFNNNYNTRSNKQH
jgi:hypothetical protein